MAKIDDSVKKKVPELRFPGFTDDWEERKLGEVYNFQYGQFNNNPDNGGQYPIYGANGIIGGYDEYNSENAIVIGHMGAYAGHVLWAEGKHFVTYNGTMGIADKSILNSNFGYYLVVSVNVPKLTAGSGQPFVSYSDLNGIKILIPTIEEQQKIGSFFKQLDNTITLHQRKLDLLKEQKKGYLQKMFPKNGEKVPELRFAGFADDWEQRKLGKMGYTFTGLSGKTKEDFGHGNAKFVTYMNVFSSPVSNSEMVENVEVDSKQHQVEYGDVFFTTSSETPQEVGMSSVWLETAENIYLNSFCFGYHPMVEFDPYYLAFMLRSPVIRKKFMLLAQGISRYNISKNKVMEMLVPVPEIVEQQKIGAFFKQLDDTIVLHQRKLDLLKEQKKGFLQNMFV